MSYGVFTCCGSLTKLKLVALVAFSTKTIAVVGLETSAENTGVLLHV